MRLKAIGHALVCTLLIGQTFGQDGTQRQLSIEHRIFIPAAGCDNGRAISNFALPVQGAPTPNCVNSGKTRSFAFNERSKNTNRINGLGTLVVLGISRAQVVLAADSRSGRIDYKTHTFKGVNDGRCKLVKLKSDNDVRCDRSHS
jgi:hypothetical protein